MDSSNVVNKSIGAVLSGAVIALGFSSGVIPAVIATVYTASIVGNAINKINNEEYHEH